jgi:site-specific DNA-methyltransferase (adenine-specific)
MIKRCEMMRTMIPILETPHGALYEADCLDFLRAQEDECADLVFADPPFNLGKDYPSGIDDLQASSDYIAWSELWLAQMVRVLKPGGSLFLWNLPKWNLPLGAFLGQHLTFRNWIAVEIKYSLPISGRLYPSHYSLLYFVKGDRAAIFHPDRLPVACCRHCGGEIPDYGGYKDKMNPKGVNLSDVWTDIPPVRHKKYKRRGANELSLRLMDRIVSMASDPGSLVLDPFGGAGTTFVAAELTERRWLGCELDCEDILRRFDALDADLENLERIHANKNTLFTDADIRRRAAQGRPLSRQYRVVEPDGVCVCGAGPSDETSASA